MDGTLLDDRKDISRDNIEAVRLLKEAGIYFVIATGRHDSMIKAYLDELNIEMPVISCNGAIVREPFSGKVFSSSPLASDQVLKVIEAVRDAGADYHIYCSETVFGEKLSGKIHYYSERNRKLPNREQIRLRIDSDFRGFIKNTEEKFYKILVLSSEQSILDSAGKNIFRATGLTASQSDKELIDVMQTGISKAEAMSELCRKLGIKREETAAIGDQLNDLDMLNWAGTGIAMANAVEPVKAVAQMVTKGTNNQSGVAEAIGKLLQS